MATGRRQVVFLQEHLERRVRRPGVIEVDAPGDEYGEKAAEEYAHRFLIEAFFRRLVLPPHAARQKEAHRANDREHSTDDPVAVPNAVDAGVPIFLHRDIYGIHPMLGKGGAGDKGNQHDGAEPHGNGKRYL